MKRWWLLLFLVFVFPYLPLIVAGFAWLYERRLFWMWLALTGVLTFVSWGLGRWLRARRMRPAVSAVDGSRGADGVEPDPRWALAGQAAWQQVEAIARRCQEQDLPLDRPEPMWDVLKEVLHVVAENFRPEMKEPSLEIPIPDVLRVVELVARDFHDAFSEHVPGSHILTLRDLKRLHGLAGWGQELYSIYRGILRVVRFGVNPLSAAISEVRDLAAGSFYDTSTVEIKRWAIGYCVRKAGFYAIQLYSGQLVDDATLAAYRTRRSQADGAQAREADRREAEEPLRILVLGQVKAGKSSLINALFGEIRAAVDVVPRTKSLQPYVLEREGIPRAIILDTAGYEEASFAAAREPILQSDAVLLVCSAQSASRQADRRLLDGLRAFFHERPDRVVPPVVVVLTHIDQLRPLGEWNPPYDLAHPVSPKALNIVDAMQAVEQDLDLAADQPVVPVCLHPERLYSLEEALIPALLSVIPEARRVKYLRCLRSFHDEQYWQRLWQQAVNSGRILLKAMRRPG